MKTAKSQVIVNKELINNLFNNNVFKNTFINLFYRWRDEYEWEDINNYAPIIKTAINKSAKKDFVLSIKMTKRPFGFKVNVAKYEFHTKDGGVVVHPATVVFKVTASGVYSWSAKVR